MLCPTLFAYAGAMDFHRGSDAMHRWRGQVEVFPGMPDGHRAAGR